MEYIEKFTNLSRQLGYSDLVSVGVSSTVGCGIFFLLALIVRYSGLYAPGAMGLAAILNIIVGYTYSEIGSKYQSNTAENEIIADIFGEKMSNLSSMFLSIYMLFNIVTIILSFVNLLEVTAIQKYTLIAVITTVCSGINVLGIGLSKTIINTITGFVVVVLGAVILMATPGLKLPNFDDMNMSSVTSNSVIYASFLAIFLFTGYDSIVKMSDEIKDPGREIPRSMNTTLLIISAIYILITLVGSNLDWRAVARSSSPITTIYELVTGNKTVAQYITGFSMIFVLATFFTLNMSFTRWIFGLSKQDKIPSIFSSINEKYKTPHFAVIATGILVFLGSFVGNGERGATIANIFFLLYVTALMVSLVKMRRSEKTSVSVDKQSRADEKAGDRGYRMPGYYGNIPVLPVVGSVMSIGYVLFILVRNFW